MVSRLHLFLLAFIFSLTTVQAQQTPVNVNVNVIPPYSMYLSDYMQGSNKVVVTLVNQSMSETRRVKLQWQLTGTNNDVSARTEQDAMPQNPIVLQPGQSITLSAQELRSRYQSFSRNDIEVEGMDLRSNLSNQTLPEGIYNLCAQALQYETNEPLSAGKPVGCSQPIRISIVDPPRIMKPRNQASITSPSPQFINFNWIPVNTRNNNIEYRFKMVDITGADISPYDAMQSENFKVYETRNLNQNFLNYGMAKPLLEDGHRYAVQVQAYDPTNQTRIKNNGKSEIHTFTYQQRQIVQSLLPDDFSPLLPPFLSPTLDTTPQDTAELTSTAAQGQGTYNCGSGCQYDLSNVSKQHSTQIGQGDTIQMGHFNIHLQAADNAPNGIEGLGVVTNAKFMQSATGQSQQQSSSSGTSNTLIVELKKVKVNQNGRAFAGKAQIEVDKDMLQGFVQGQKAKEYLKQGISLKELYGKISGNSGVQGKAPIKLKKGFAHIRMIDLQLTPEKATASLVGMLELKDDRIRDKYMVFSSSDICLNPQGPVISEDEAFLQLVKPVTVDISKNYTVTLLPARNQNTKQKQGTYLNFDCKGFRDVEAYGMVKFTGGQFIPKNNGQFSKKDTLAATFNTAFKNWDHWVAQLDFTSLPPQINKTQKLATEHFGYKKLPGYTFEVEKAYIDHSSKEDLFQKLGSSNPVAANAGAGWQGVYVSKSEVWMPDFFSKKPSDKQKQNNKQGDNSQGNNQGNNTQGSNNAIHLTGTDLVMDARGVSGEIFGTQVMEEGTMGNMPLSIDTVDVALRHSMLEHARMTGGLTIPVFKDPMPYKASITYTGQQASYSFDLKTGKERRIPMWMVTTQLDANSTVQLDIRQQDVDFEAILNGRFYFDPTLGAVPDVQIKGMRFEDFKISTREPHLDISNFGVNTNLEAPRVVGYPTDLKNLQLKTPQGSYAANLQFDLRFNLADKKMSQISGESELRLYSSIDTQMTQSGRIMPNFKFRGAEVDSVRVNAKWGPLSFDGSLDMYKNDRTFGSGFDGDLQLKAFGSPAFTGNALFGQKEQSNSTLRYWYVDGMATFFNTGIPLGGPVGLFGFGGGAYHNLTRKSQMQASYLQSNPVRDAATVRNQYEPKKGVTGLKASTIFGLKLVPFVVNADARLEATVQRNPFKVNTFSLDGNAYALTQLKDRSNPPVEGSLKADFIREEKFKFNTSFNINMPPQLPIITGSGSVDFKARLAEKGSNSDYWYLRLGTPKNRVGISLGFKDFTLAQTNAYFMAGKDLISPTLPTHVKNYFDDYTSSLNQKQIIEKGEGVAAGLSFNTDMKLGGKVARLEASAAMGADVTVIRYAPPVKCSGRSDFGLNRWYANGRGYLYGDLGFFVAQKEVLGVNAGTLVEVGLPNPVGVEGRIKAGINVLGGTINFNQQFTMGNICSFEIEEGESVTVESPVKEMEFISDVTPTNHKSGLGLFTKPQITLEKNTYYDRTETYTFSDGKGGTRKTTYKFDFEYDWQKKTGPGEWDPVGIEAGTVVGDYDDDNQTLTLALKKDYSEDQSEWAEEDNTNYKKVMLDGHTTYRVKAKVVVREKTGKGEDSWKPATYNTGSLKGEKIQQVVVHTFSTGSPPERIGDQYIEEVLPARRARYFTQDDYSSGYVKLSTNVTTVWDSLETEGYDLKAKFEPINLQQQGKKVDVSKRENGRELRFDIPQLKNETIYQLQVIAAPPSEDDDESESGAGTMDAPGESLWDDSESGEMSDTKVSKTQEAIDRVVGPIRTRVLFTSYFQTSQFNTLQEKIGSLEVNKTRVKSKPIPPVVKSRHNLAGRKRFDVIEVVFTGPEPFGHFDLRSQHEGSVHLTASDQGTVHGWHAEIDDRWKGSYCLGRNRYTEVTEGWQFPNLEPEETYSLWNPSDPNVQSLVRDPLSDSEVGIEQSSGHTGKDYTSFTPPANYSSFVSMVGESQQLNPKVLRVRYYGDLNARTNWGNKRRLCGEDDHYELESYPDVEQGDQLYLHLSGSNVVPSTSANDFTITVQNP